MVLELDGKQVSQKIRDNLKAKLKSFDFTPKLVVIQLGKDDEGSNLYVKYKKKAAQEVGIIGITHEIDRSTSQRELLTLLSQLNGEESVDGILVQMPLPDHIDTWEVIKHLDPLKDVDGFHPLNSWALDNKLPSLIPCTPKGILTILKEYNIQIEGSNVVIINRSHLVGNPLHKLLRMYNATVTQCHSRTKNLQDVAQQAQILVTATGNPNLITENWVTEESVVIDVSSPKGDCNAHYENIKNKVKAITPVPGGIGPMTIASLLENVVDAAKRRRSFN